MVGGRQSDHGQGKKKDGEPKIRRGTQTPKNEVREREKGRKVKTGDAGLTG